MNNIEALKVMKAGCEVEQCFRDPIAIREKLRYLTDIDTIQLWLDGFDSKGPTDIMSPATFLTAHQNAEFVLFEK